LLAMLIYLDSKNIQEQEQIEYNPYKLEHWKVLKTLIICVLKHLLRTNYCDRVEQIMVEKGDKFVTHWKNKYALKSFSYDILSSALVDENCSSNMNMHVNVNMNMSSSATLSSVAAAALSGAAVASSRMRVAFVTCGIDFPAISKYCLEQSKSSLSNVMKDSEDQEELEMQSALMDVTEQLWDD